MAILARFMRQTPQPRIDLATMRDTLDYMHDDACRTPGMERVAEALAASLSAIDALEARPVVRPGDDVIAARFVPYRREAT